MGVLFAVALVLVAIGLTTVVSWLLPSAGATVPIRPPRTFFGLLWLFLLLALFRGLMGRFGSPLGAMVEAADRVAAGDYSTRTPERTRTEAPPALSAASTLASRSQTVFQVDAADMLGGSDRLLGSAPNACEA